MIQSLIFDHEKQYLCLQGTWKVWVLKRNHISWNSKLKNSQGSTSTVEDLVANQWEDYFLKIIEISYFHQIGWDVDDKIRMLMKIRCSVIQPKNRTYHLYIKSL